MTKERAIEIIQRFPTTPPENSCVVYVVYNNDMVEAAKNLIAEVLGKEYLAKHVHVTADVRTLPFELSSKMRIVYSDPALYDYNGNGYN